MALPEQGIAACVLIVNDSRELPRHGKTAARCWRNLRSVFSLLSASSLWGEFFPARSGTEERRELRALPAAFGAERRKSHNLLGPARRRRRISSKTPCSQSRCATFLSFRRRTCSERGGRRWAFCLCRGIRLLMKADSTGQGRWGNTPR